MCKTIPKRIPTGNFIGNFQVVSAFLSLLFVSGLCSIANSSKADEPAGAVLFDGKTLSGWHARDKTLWRVEGAALTGGSLETTVAHSSFLVSEKRCRNFDLYLKIRLLGEEGFVNSGIQVRSVRLPDSHEVSGYQVDVGDGWWGKLYDESRRNKVIAEAANMQAVNAAVISDGWNEYRILCNGSRITTWINGVPAIDYVEEDESIAQDGHIGIQIHGGGKTMVQVKDISIIQLPDTLGSST